MEVSVATSLAEVREEGVEDGAEEAAAMSLPEPAAVFFSVCFDGLGGVDEDDAVA